MLASQREINASRVCCLHDELDGKPFNREHWSGYHPLAYSTHYDLDKGVAHLCARLKAIDVTQYSLEMQMWWRDHQIADRARIAKEEAARVDPR